MADSSLSIESGESIFIENGNSAWSLIMQSGVGYQCTVGISVSEFLQNVMCLSEDRIATIESVLIDGMPVDSPDETILPDGCRLALAAGLPGAAGLAMKINSGFKALRPGITYRQNDIRDPRPGRITLLLYALVLPTLAPGVLRHGVYATRDQLLRYSRFAPDDTCQYEGRTLSVHELQNCLARQNDGKMYMLTVISS